MSNTENSEIRNKKDNFRRNYRNNNPNNNRNERNRNPRNPRNNRRNRNRRKNTKSFKPDHRPDMRILTADGQLQKYPHEYTERDVLVIIICLMIKQYIINY